MGFEKYAKHIMRFSLLNENLDSNQQGIYYHRWENRYKKIPRSNLAIIEWDIRHRKALKEIATSATFFVESKLVRKHNCFSAYYFLCYYSLFHAMLSTLYLDDQLKLESLIVLSHQRVQSNFVNNFRPNKNPIISSDINSHFTLLKSLREYYSYSMPMNEFFHNVELESPENFLENDIKQCFQLTSLHSLILSNSLNGVIRPSELNQEEWAFFEEWFCKVNVKQHPFKGNYMLDPADRNSRNEMREYGFGIDHLSIDLEHFLDEFKTYQSCVNFETNGTQNIGDIDSLIYSSII